MFTNYIFVVYVSNNFCVGVYREEKSGFQNFNTSFFFTFNLVTAVRHIVATNSAQKCFHLYLLN